MTKLQILGVAGLVLVVGTADLMAQRRGGGAVRGGMRGAMVGGLAGGSAGAATGAKIGVAAGATRGAVQRADARAAQRSVMDAETQARLQYQASAEYQTTPHSNFYEAPPTVIAPSTPAAFAASDAEAIIRKNGRPILGITYPSDWKQNVGDHYISAVSGDGRAWSVLSTLEGIQDKQAGIARVKQGLAQYLQNIEYDDMTQTEGGALVITGTGTGKKAGVDVVFAAGVFDAGGGGLAGAAFVVDADLEQHYKEAVRFMCQTIRTANDFAE